MIELVNTTPVTVPVGQSIPFSAVATKGGCAERHRAGSAQITLVKPGRYLITFSGNVAVPTGETVGEVALGIARDGEILGGTVMRATPAAVEQYFNASSQTYVDVFCGCCENVSIDNILGFLEVRKTQYSCGFADLAIIGNWFLQQICNRFQAK